MRMNMERKRMLLGLAFISPWLAGFLVLALYPLLSSFYFSLTDYSVLSRPVFIGTQNYTDLATDPVFWQAIYNTLYFALLAIPGGILVALALALLLNADIRGRGIFRTLFFLPSLVPMVALAVLWQWLLNGELGLVNNWVVRPLLTPVNALFGLDLQPPNWLQDAAWSRLGLVFTGVWGAGNAMVIFLAGLQDVPRQLYEAAEIDGAGYWRKTWHVTLPMISPVIYFNGVMGLIGSLQVFAVPYVLTGGEDGPERSLLFIATYIYKSAFDYWNMGYACAMALILFLIILGLTLLTQSLSARHIHYEA